jgi:hypothetical protein
MHLSFLKVTISTFSLDPYFLRWTIFWKQVLEVSFLYTDSCMSGLPGDAPPLDLVDPRKSLLKGPKECMDGSGELDQVDHIPAPGILICIRTYQAAGVVLLGCH